MNKQKQMKVPVTTRALIQRINRKLAPDGERLCTSRGPNPSLGAYYVLDTYRNTVVRYGFQTGAELVELATELNAFAPWETLVDGSEAVEATG